MAIVNTKPKKTDTQIERNIQAAADQGSEIQLVQLRIPKSALKLIDETIRLSIFPASRHNWILKAIEEAIARAQQEQL